MAAFRSGIHGVNGVKSATSLTYQIFFAGSQRAPSALAASFSAYGTFKSILMGELSVSVGHGDRWRTVGDHRHRQRSRNLPKVAKGNCRKPTQKVETPQNPKRALGRMCTGGLGRNRTTDTRIFSPLLYRLSYRARAGEYSSISLASKASNQAA